MSNDELNISLSVDELAVLLIVLREAKDRLEYNISRVRAKELSVYYPRLEAIESILKKASELR